MKLFWIFLAFISGAFLPIQAGLNGRLGKSIDSPVYAALISFLVGILTILVYIMVTRQQFSWEGLKTVPPYAWLGGALGAVFVTAIIQIIPHIGIALTFGLVVAGQMIIAVIMDHFHILVAQQQNFNPWRLLGIVLVIAGVVIIRKF